MTHPGRPAPPTGTAVADWSVWTTTARLIVTDPGCRAEGQRRVKQLLAEIDRAASRFRDDSEVVAVLRSGGRPVRVSSLLADLVRIALAAATATEGAVDPTVGDRLRQLGYDRDLPPVPDGGPLADHRVQPRVRLSTDWRDIRLDGDELTTPAGMLLDLGATAKAAAADRSAAAVAALGCGALVSLGGDIATAGPAPHGPDGHRYWRVRVQDGADQPGATVTLAAGQAIATSSTRHRRWLRSAQLLHHVLDPRTGWPAAPVWRTVTVAGGDCVTANTASTAALVRGDAAVRYLGGTGQPARLVAADGTVHTLNGWPAEVAA